MWYITFELKSWACQRSHYLKKKVTRTTELSLLRGPCYNVMKKLLMSAIFLKKFNLQKYRWIWITRSHWTWRGRSWKRGCVRWHRALRVLCYIDVSDKTKHKWTGFYMITASVLKGLSNHKAMGFAQPLRPKLDTSFPKTKRWI